MAPFIIAFAGHAGCGKDTAADYLVERYGFKKMALADPIKQIAKELFGFSNEQLWGPSEERNKPDMRYPFSGRCPYCREACLLRASFVRVHEYHCPVCCEDFGTHLSPRVVLRSLGTEWGRALAPDIWLRRVLLEAESHEAVVISDVRFRNEVRGLRAAGAFVVRIFRPGAERSSNHASEAELDSTDRSEFNSVVWNNGSLPRLYVRVDLLRSDALDSRRTRCL